MFEAIHGSAPDIAGRGVANPSGLLLASVMMLVHIGQGNTASLVHHALLRTIEDGLHTSDIYSPEVSQRQVGTEEFTEAVVARLGMEPRQLRKTGYPTIQRPPAIRVKQRAPAHKEIVGVDVFVHRSGGDAEGLALELKAGEADGMTLTMITNRGVKVWPQGLPETFCTDHWRCRFQTSGSPIGHREVAHLLLRLCNTRLDVIKTENLCTFDGEPGFSLGQGQ